MVDMAAATLAVGGATLAAVAPRYTEVVVGMEATVVMEGPIEASEELAQSEASVGMLEFTVGVEARVEVVDIQSLQFLAKDSSADKPDRAILREARPDAIRRNS